MRLNTYLMPSNNCTKSALIGVDPCSVECTWHGTMGEACILVNARIYQGSFTQVSTSSPQAT
eukprot:15367151-Ditylum_brightwellii.AAC.1